MHEAKDMEKMAKQQRASGAFPGIKKPAKEKAPRRASLKEPWWRQLP